MKLNTKTISENQWSLFDFSSSLPKLKALATGTAVAACLCCHSVFADEVSNASQNRVIQLDTLIVEGDDTDYSDQLIDQQSLNLPKIIDLSEVIASELIEASMVRKSGYGNEINLRGFSQANLPVLINGGFVEGACGSRKDPSLSHINLLTVERLLVRQGPFDVTQPGSLGGYVNVFTKQPYRDFTGELLARAGSYDFYSAGFTTTGGAGGVKVRVGYNHSESGQYEDGSGTALWELRSGMGGSYNEAGQSAKAFSKEDLWGTMQYDLSENQSVTLNYSWGEAKDILTSRVAMDTAKETTKLAGLIWELEESTAAFDRLKLNIYRNDVGHYPNHKYRNVGAPKNVISKTTLSGVKLQATKEVGEVDFAYGGDLSRRKWNADVFHSTSGAVANGMLIPFARNENLGLFARAESKKEHWVWSAGLRFDQNESKAEESLAFVQQRTSANLNKDSLLGGFASLRYQKDESTEYFFGLGRSYRVPNSAERYIQGSKIFVGNPELEPTANTEFDLGWVKSGDGWNMQVKGFYSDLKDYIYQVYSLDGFQTYTNIDAHIYGGDIKAHGFWKNGLSMDAGVAIHRGKKDSQPANNTDSDLGQMAPYKSRIAVNYDRKLDWQDQSFVWYSTVEVIHSGKNEDVDSDAGEVELDSWTTLNLRLGLRSSAWSFICGVDNLMDETYAVANSYEWDVISGAGSNPLIVNEPGRFVYLSLGYQW